MLFTRPTHEPQLNACGTLHQLYQKLSERYVIQKYKHDLRVICLKIHASE